MKIILFILIELSILCNTTFAKEPIQIKTQICIVGAGSGGIGAALAAARAGANVVLVEKLGKVGGTSTMAFVNRWAPGIGCDFSNEIYNRLKVYPNAVGISKLVHVYQNAEPYAISLQDSNGIYNQTLRRSDLPDPGGVIYDFEKFDEVIRQMLLETGKCKLILNTSFTKATSKGKTVKTIEAVSVSGEKFEISAKVFIDCTGNLSLCRDLGCETMLGADAKSAFNESSAPEVANNNLNAISLCYQIRKANYPEQVTPEIKGTFDYNFVAVSDDVPGKGNIKSINPLGIMEGSELLKLGYDSAYQIAKKIVDDHWAKLKKYPQFKDYEFDCYAPMLGVRESYRLVGEYVLNQNDLLVGWKNQKQKDIIALADHPMDVHGKNTKLGFITEAYGVPYRCLIPKGWSNLLVACRGASFSQIAASSCRLSRTMISLGHAAGFAASIAAKENIPVINVPIERIQAEMNLKLRSKEDKRADPMPINKLIGESKNSYLVSDNGSNKIYILNSQGEISWEYPVSQCQDLHQLPNGNILFTYYGQKGDAVKGGVCEITPEKKEVFSFEIDGEVHSCQRLINGNTLLTDNNNARLIEVSPLKEVVKTISLTTNVKGHKAIRIVRVLDNGNYLVCLSEDHLVVEYNPKGKIVNSFKSPGDCFAAIRLQNGNTLISDGSACSVREVNHNGKVVWKISQDDFPELHLKWISGIQELPDGNILVCNWLGHGKSGAGIPMFVITREKKIVWYFLDNVSTKSISNVCLLN